MIFDMCFCDTFAESPEPKFGVMYDVFLRFGLLYTDTIRVEEDRSRVFENTYPIYSFHDYIPGRTTMKSACQDILHRLL